MTSTGANASPRSEWEHRTADGIEYGGQTPRGKPLGPVEGLFRAIRTVVQSRRVIWLLATHDYKSNFRAQSLGMFWAIGQPLIMLITLTVAFTYILRVPVPNFPVFFFSGMICWQLFISSLLACSNSFFSRASLIKRTNFPRYIIPVIALTTQLIAFTVELALLYSLYVVFPDAFRFGFALLFIPVVWFFLLAMSFGAGLLAASLNVRYRDVSYVVAAIATVGFWVTPILYSTTMAPDWIRPWLRLNPLAGVVEGTRGIIMQGRIPEFTSLVPAMAGGIVLILIGAMAYRRQSTTMADYL